MKVWFFATALFVTSTVAAPELPVATESEKARAEAGEIIETRSRTRDALNQRVLGVVDAPLSWIVSELRSLCRPASKRVSQARLLLSPDVAVLLALPPAERTQEKFAIAKARPCVLPEDEPAGFVYSEAALPVLGKKWTLLKYQFEKTKGDVVITTTSLAGNLGEVQSVVVLRPLDQNRTLYASATNLVVPFPVPDFLWNREPSEGAERIRILREAWMRRSPRTDGGGRQRVP